MGYLTDIPAAPPAAGESPLPGVPPTAGLCNIARHLPRMAAQVPEQKAVVVTARRDRDGRAVYESMTFARMEALSNRYASGLAVCGFLRGQRVLMMVRPGFDFIALTFALFKLGAVPVLIDPGMGITRMLECIRNVDVQGFIGIPRAQVLRVLRPGAFRTVTHCVTVGRRCGWGGFTLKEVAARGTDRFDPVATRGDETAAILFTSGSTGPAKGVIYEHGMFEAQVRRIQAHYRILPGEVDLPALPVFALFSTAMGMTCVVPDMDPSRPARINPAHFVRSIQDHAVTNTFGSPAIWKRVVPYCQQHDIKLMSLKRVLVAGCAVPPKLIAQLRERLSADADVHTPYGATEALPVCSIAGDELLNRAAGFGPREGAPTDRDPDSPADAAATGHGTCVGRPLPGIEVRVIRITDDSISDWTDDLLVPDGAYGELTVSGPVVTGAYWNQPRANALSKIRDGAIAWHRMGDVGYRDAQGRLWFCGRKSQRVTTAHGVLFPDQCEAVFNEHPGVARCALVGVPAEPRASVRANRQSAIDNRQSPIIRVPVLVVEPAPGPFPRWTRDALRNELLALARGSALTRDIAHVLFHRALPVDVRHNAKINREALARWAATRIP